MVTLKMKKILIKGYRNSFVSFTYAKIHSKFDLVK